MKTKHKKLKKCCYYSLFILFSLIFVTSWTTSCSSVNKQEIPITTPKDDEEDLSNLNADSFFPKIYKEDYWDLVEFKNHKPFISQKLKLKIINDVISRVALNKGKISYFIEEKPNYELITTVFHFKWEYKSLTLHKSYYFSFKKFE